MSFEVVSEEGHEDYEIWTCDVCGYSITLQGVGGDVCCCPKCEEREAKAEAEREEARELEDDIRQDRKEEEEYEKEN